MKRPPFVQVAAQATLRVLWVGVIPGLLAALCIGYLVPPSGLGLRGLVASLGHAHPVQLGAVLFLLFSLMARYWRFHVPGGRYASALPAHVAPEERDAERLKDWASLTALAKAVSSPAVGGDLARTSNDARGELAARVEELEGALERADLGAARGAGDAIRRLAAPTLAAHRHREVARTVGAVGVAAVLALGLRAQVAQSYRVVSNSMIPTFEADDQLLGRRVTYGGPSRLPSRGDVIFFRSDAVTMKVSPSQPLPDVLLKRVIGLPGDTISMRGEVPVINGWQVPTCIAGAYAYLSGEGNGGNLRGMVVVEYLDDHTYLTLQSFPTPPFAGAYTVQPGEVFVLGDGRGYSVDSRSYGEHGGGVPLPAVVARADRFLVGTHRGGEADLTRLLQPVAQVEHRLHLEGMTADKLQQGIATCLARRPAETHPPPPVQARASGAVSVPGPT
jgi:signal peptidase I